MIDSILNVVKEHDLRQLMSIEELFSDMRLTLVGQDLIKFGGGHVRSLKAIRDVLIKEEERTIETNFSDLLDEALNVSSVSFLPMETATALVGAAIGSVPVTKFRPIMAIPPNMNERLTVDQIRQKGYCTTVPVGGNQVIPILTPAQIVLFVRHRYPNFHKHFQGSFRSRNEQRLFGGLQFELFHSIFDALSRMLCVDGTLTRLKKISIRQLYNRNLTHDNNGEEDDTIPLFDKYLNFESGMQCLDYFLTKDGRATGKEIYVH